jgi:hypothetical protein
MSIQKINNFACYKKFENKINKEIQANEIISYIVEHELDENFTFNNERIF